ncbi:hypothetical protein N8I77_011733 [Diaporthe amygdali]|uniref:SET domain-containing protein n=1 Tax=Phomopsis amygdali TaxID=1214568 RepID=A0AAD9S399_PHOAM|nr:hypothetical protein N8I77_011733 [Diaporthe amygdali]
MSTPTSVDKLGHRAQRPPDQADTNPRSPYNKALPDEAHNKQVFNNDSVPASGPDASESPAGPVFSPSISHTSDTSSTSSPLSSSFENNPREDSSSSSNYDSESSTEGAEARSKKIADYVTVGEQIAWRKDENEDAPKGTSLMDFENKIPDYSVSAEKDKRLEDTHTATITTGSRHTPRSIDTCLGSGWGPGDALPNRTFANEYIRVAKSPLQGYGAFAATDIKEGTRILLEEPLLRVNGLGKLRAEHALLDGEKRAIYDGLVGYHKHEACPVLQKWSANQFDLAAGCNGVFAIASNFNHACKSQRNTHYYWDYRREAMTFMAIKDIKQGDEVLISYCDYRHMLKAVYGFVCHCGGCDHQAADLAPKVRF